MGRVFLLVALGFLLSACGRSANFIYHYVEEPPVMYSSISKIKEIQGESRVDILFVIDNSGSMGMHQTALIKNADTFISQFVRKGGLDWKMGILSTDIANTPFAGFDPGTELTAKTPDNVQLFKDAVGKLGTAGDITERTFAPIQQALTRYPHFLRSNAVLALILITDAEEQSAIPAADFLKFLIAKKGSLKRVVSYGVFACQDFGCDQADSIWNYAGSPYEKVIQETSGRAWPLCKDFGQNLADLGKDLFTRISRPAIKLTSRPRPDTLKVLYQGVPLPGGPLSEKGLWIYNFDDNSIQFHNLDFAAGDNETVEIVYEVAA